MQHSDWLINYTISDNSEKCRLIGKKDTSGFLGGSVPHGPQNRYPNFRPKYMIFHTQFST